MNAAYFFDREAWGKGAWEHEADYYSWIDSYTQYPCVGKRNLYGAWTGFVGLDCGHPLYQTDIAHQIFDHIEVHQKDVTFSGWQMDEDKSFTPMSRRWWLGFDCMGENDICPALIDEDAPRRRPSIKNKRPVYRDWLYVKDQIEYLAAQLAYYDTRLDVSTATR